MNESWFNSPGSSMVLIYSLLGILLLSKLYFRFLANKSLHRNRVLNKNVCPYCSADNEPGFECCISCTKLITENQKTVFCRNCGYIGEMDSYSKTGEFVVTLVLWSILTFPALVYFLLFRNRRICRKCGRMVRRSDHSILDGRNLGKTSEKKIGVAH